jgi:ABC-type lipoprotein release transport system permease subunit
VIVVGRDLQGNEMSLDVGEEIVLVTPLGFDERSVKKCRIVGRFKSGMYEYDSRQVYLPLDATQKLLRKTGHVSAISVRLRDYGRAQEARAQILGTLTPRELADWRGALQGVRGRDVRVALPGGDSATAAALLDGVDRDLRKLRDEYQMWMVMGNPLAQQHHDRIAARLQALTVCLRSDQDTQRRADLKRAAAFDDLLKDRRAKGIGPAYRVWTWEDKRHNTLQAVWLERRILAIILSLLILVSGFVILSILHTTVMAKTKDIGILKAIGARVGGIMSVFLLNGFFIGVIGSVLGTLGGILLAANLNVIEDLLFLWFRFRVFPRDVYSLDKIPTAQDPTLMIAIVSVSAVVASFLAALYPAWRASRMDPVETLRYE